MDLGFHAVDKALDFFAIPKRADENDRHESAALQIRVSKGPSDVLVEGSFQNAGRGAAGIHAIAHAGANGE